MSGSVSVAGMTHVVGSVGIAPFKALLMTDDFPDPLLPKTAMVNMGMASSMSYAKPYVSLGLRCKNGCAPTSAHSS
jgi:hypothetical protein